jgi:hypothetical protein
LGNNAGLLKTPTLCSVKLIRFRIAPSEQRLSSFSGTDKCGSTNDGLLLILETPPFGGHLFDPGKHSIQKLLG